MACLAPSSTTPSNFPGMGSQGGVGNWWVAQCPFRCLRKQQLRKAPYKLALILLCLSRLRRQLSWRRVKQSQVNPADFS